ncbi:hypothetical protein Tsubulata_027870 [Turnera subulata]|uniref:Uncharacterized protein n=1 Tax=Turnera subulata TaxID=218843 RepID=A0A9Q0FDR9_9ROSI|nr:hypothetical protein Tsubulata_027870 [Turnera subulata]
MIFFQNPLLRKWHKRVFNPKSLPLTLFFLSPSSLSLPESPSSLSLSSSTTAATISSSPLSASFTLLASPPCSPFEAVAAVVCRGDREERCAWSRAAAVFLELLVVFLVADLCLLVRVSAADHGFAEVLGTGQRGFDFRYAYPPPDGNILTNIVNALIAVPRFYTQVLHLMNKMNIPAPFRMALPTPPLPPLPSFVPEKSHLADLSNDKLELESSDEEVDGKATSGRPEPVKFGRKRKRKETIVGPAIDKDVAHEAVGLKRSSLVPKEIPIIKKNPVLQIKIAKRPTEIEHKDDSIVKEYEDPKKEGSNNRPYALLEEIERKRLAPEEILSLPKFKNYTVGNPASVLYVKNLDKDVVADDFFYDHYLKPLKQLRMALA